MLGIVLLLGTCGAAEAVPATASAVEVRDVMLMLDDGPLHLRFHMSLGGIAPEQAREQYIDALMKKLDEDGDGKVSRAEGARSPLRMQKERLNPNNPFTRSLPPLTRKDILEDWDRAVSSTPIVLRQDTSSANTDAEVFKFLDTDGNGKIDRAEMGAASQKILERDQDGDECISFPEFLPPPPAQDPNLVAIMPPAEPEGPRPELASLLLDANGALVGQFLRERYDRNRDGRCSPKELNWPAERVRQLDSDRNGLLNDQELQEVRKLDLDLELAVELTGPKDNQPALRVLHSTGSTGDVAKRPDYVRLTFPAVVLTVAYRHVDPMAEAQKNATQKFNEFDVDGNGYVDEVELSAPERRVYREIFFNKMDLDGDKRVFTEELEKFIALRGVPEGNIARVNLYDTGRGFFNALDRNGDGRISIRETKASEQSLSSMKRKKGDALSPTEPARHFHLEFARSFYVLAGRTDQLISMTPSFEQRPLIGPVWFQRMDRNGDGDVTWNEFLGPRDVFHRLDADHDGLLDPMEAAAAE